MTIHPLEDHIVVEPRQPEEVTKGGIVLPEQSRQREQFGTVLAVGPGLCLSDGTRKAVTVKAGDTVMYGRYGGGDPVTLDGRECLVMRESDLLATVSE